MAVSRHRLKLVSDVLLGLLALCAGAEFLIRGPVRFAHARNFNDFISPYIQTQAWMHGEDPYSPQNLVRLWPHDAARSDFLARDLADGSLGLKRGIPTAYPLTAFVLFTPFASLSWHVAHPVWLIVTVLSFAVTVVCVMSVAKFVPRSRRSLAFLAIALALAPFHTGLAAGSIVIVAVAASAAAVWTAEREHDILAGVLLAVSVSLKPQIGLPFLFYYLVRRRWRTAALAGAVIALLLGVSLARLSISGTPWVQNYLYDNRTLFAVGSLGDFTEKDPLRFGLINFQVAAYTLLENRDRAIVTAFVLAGAAGVVWLYVLNKRRNRQGGLLELSALAVVSLLPIYHRLYDASLLIFPLAWSLTAIEDRLRPIARCVLVVILLVFLVPGGSALEQWQQSGHFAAIKNYWWWNMIVLPHESWSILILSLLLLRAMQITASPGPCR
jgi:hypothetical protein